MTHIKALLEYPKFCCLLLSCVLAYILFQVGAFDILVTTLNGHGYVSVFLAGLLFSFGFTTPFAIAIFVELAPDVHPVLAALVGGLGAVIADMGMFEFARFSFHDEIVRLKRTRPFRWVHTLFHHPGISDTLRTYLLWSFAGLIIASPLPDEFGVSLLSGVDEIDDRRFAALCYIMNCLGIFAVIGGTRMLG